MTPTTVVLLAVLAVILLVVLVLVTMYNRFVRQRTLVEESWRQIDVELTRRHDLVPALVSTVQGYAAHEKELLDRVVRAREEAAAHRGEAPHAREGAEGALGGAMSEVMVRAEAYPDLKASANFLQLQHELTNTEDRIAAARRFYNGNVRALNTRVGTFPSNIVAGMFGFTRAEFFDLPDHVSATPPQVTP